MLGNNLIPALPPFSRVGFALVIAVRQRQSAVAKERYASEQERPYTRAKRQRVWLYGSPLRKPSAFAGLTSNTRATCSFRLVGGGEPSELRLIGHTYGITLDHEVEAFGQ